MRCSWCNEKNKKYVDYHDNEWGVLNTSDDYLFEMLILEGFQAGLSWECILNKRGSFKKAYDNFNLDKVCNYDNKKIEELINNKDIVRNKLKIKSSIINAKIFREIKLEYNGFINYLNREYNTNIDFSNLNIKSKLKRYYDLDFDEFLEEVKKKSKPKSILKKRENIENLEEEFNKSKEILLPLKVEINKINDTINSEVYKLYNLSDEDIRIIEAKYNQTLV